MNKYATSETCLRVLVWLIWFIVLVAAIDISGVQVANPTPAPLLGVVSHDASRSGPLFPWQARTRWKKWALQRYRKWRTEYRRAKRRVQLVKLAPEWGDDDGSCGGPAHGQPATLQSRHLTGPLCTAFRSELHLDEVSLFCFQSAKNRLRKPDRHVNPNDIHSRSE